MKYLLLHGVFSRKVGPSSFDWSLFIDTEDKYEPDLTLITKRQEKKKHFTRRYSTSVSFKKV